MSMVSAKAEWEVGNGDYLLHYQFDTYRFTEPYYYYSKYLDFELCWWEKFRVDYNLILRHLFCTSR